MNLDRFDVQTIKNIELRRKPFKTAKLQKWSKYNDFHRFDVKYIKTTQNYKNYQITWIASIWCQNYQNNAKLQKRSNWTSKRAKMLSYVENIQNNAKLQKWSKYNDLHRFDVKTIKATQNSKRDQMTMNLDRFDVQTIKNIELRRKPFKTAKLQKWSKYNDFHRFDVKYTKQHKTTKTITLDELHLFDVQTIKTTQNYKSDQITMNCMHLTSKRTKMSR